MYGDCRIRETHEHFDIIDEIEAENIINKLDCYRNVAK